ncbi:hypothetical protein ACM41_00520 [Bradyrhizobium sp. CCBAU 21362]|nr:hypothetical protein [Bradyrhizobium sp. CCBAU 21362]
MFLSLLVTGGHVFRRLLTGGHAEAWKWQGEPRRILIETPLAPAQLPTAISQLPNIGARPGGHQAAVCKDLTQRDQCSAKIAIIARPAPVTHQQDSSSIRMKRPPRALPETRIHREPGPRKHFPPLVN